MRLIFTLLGFAVLLLAAALTFKLVEFVPDHPAGRTTPASSAGTAVEQAR